MRNSERGATMTEYALAAALVVILLLGAMRQLETVYRNRGTAAGESMSGTKYNTSTQKYDYKGMAACGAGLSGPECL